MDSIRLYIKESINELLNKVTWPTWSNLQSSTIVVIIASFILALIIFLMDSVSNGMLKFIYNLNA
ncbi:MAG: preprotein translocase subunit SecE [Saprospiraceae bacterium]|jgi:preprotein translocase subunit SecE